VGCIEQLIGYNVLKELNLAYTSDSVGASILLAALLTIQASKNRSRFCTVKVPKPSVLFVKAWRKHDTRHLDVRDNRDFDSICATALKLDTMSWRGLIS
jgi:hypothetical protein